jgi:pimeloyl-ACP methyl ester carboxylesterase
MKKAPLWLLKIPLYLFGAVVVVLLILGARAFFIMPDLETWHATQQGQEDFAYDRYERFADYLADEKKLLERVYAAVGKDEVTANKYARQSTRSPYGDGKNLNASFEMFPKRDSLAGGVLLVHGLSDSPYHMRAVAEVFSAQGYYVLGLRLPGHGTVPGALVNVEWKDWYNAVDFGTRKVLEKIKANSEAKFIAGGFSTGAR